jgi:serine/threonine protein kinase
MAVVTLKAHDGLSDRGARHVVTARPAPTPRFNDLEPGDIIDGFRIMRILARSGMGSIYKAHDRATGTTVVLKVPHMSCECDVVLYARFQREERIGLRLSHPGIVRVLAAPDKCRPYLVIEHVDGPSLLHVLRSEGRLQPARVVAIGLQLCEALIYMHNQGVIHRDLKPENVLVDADDTARIIDFGIALDYRDRRLTWGRLSNRLGTPEYMAPEQIRGRRGDVRVDVYSLGAMMYELLAGSTPFPRGSVAALMKAKLRDDPIPLGNAAPDIPPSLAAWVMRAIARDPEDRFSTVAEMRRALADPTRHVPLVTPERRRRPAGARATVVALLAFLALAWFMMRHA